MKKFIVVLLGFFLFTATGFAQEYPVSEKSYQSINDATRTFVNFIKLLKQGEAQGQVKRNQQLEQMFTQAYYLSSMLRSLGLMIKMEQQHGLKEQYNGIAAAIIGKYSESIGQEVNAQSTFLDNISTNTKDAVVLKLVGRHREQLAQIADVLADLGSQLKVK